LQRILRCLPAVTAAWVAKAFASSSDCVRHSIPGQCLWRPAECPHVTTMVEADTATTEQVVKMGVLISWRSKSLPS
jgi:hypothetical protein